MSEAIASEWYYKIFGQEFGPVPFSELKSVAEYGMLTQNDVVRRDGMAEWMKASFVQELKPLLQAQKGDGASAEIASPSARRSAASDEWYCKINGEELGPLAYEELAGFAKQGHLSGNDEIRMGTQGNWTRVSAVARLMAVMPKSRPQPQPASPAVAAKAPTPTAAANGRPAAPAPAPKVEKPPVDRETELAINALTAHQAIEHGAELLMSCTLNRNCDKAWWGWVGGAEYGPVDFAQIFSWVISGRLQPTDFVRNGPQGQYIAAGTIPGLFVASNIVKLATEVFELAQSRIGAARIEAAMSEKAPAEARQPAPQNPVRLTS